MLKASIFILSLLLSAGLVAAFGFAALAVCFGLAFLTLVGSTQGCNEEEIAEAATAPTAGLQVIR